jgi:hypothetical protein
VPDRVYCCRHDSSGEFKQEELKIANACGFSKSSDPMSRRVEELASARRVTMRAV